MEPLILLFFLVLNFGISFWNAYACGAYFTEAKLIGGWTRFLVWCGLIMSACGFTWCYLTLMTMGAVAGEWLTPEDAELMFKLGYLIIIGPVLGSGMGIWINSLVEAYRRRTFGSVALAGWNTFAQVKNTLDAASHAPGFLKDVIDGLGSKRRGKNDGAAILIILLVILALAGGIITTACIARWSDRKHVLDIVDDEAQPQRRRA